MYIYIYIYTYLYIHTYIHTYTQYLPWSSWFWTGQAEHVQAAVQAKGGSSRALQAQPRKLCLVLQKLGKTLKRLPRSRKLMSSIRGQPRRGQHHLWISCAASRSCSASERGWDPQRA